MFLYNGIKFNPDIQHVIGDTQYPRGWFTDAAERAKLGIIEVADIPRPDPMFFDATENADGSWTSTPRDPTVIAADQIAILINLLEQQRASRAEAYRTESDPLFFKSQRGQATVDEWQAKVAEIKARLPYPEV